MKLRLLLAAAVFTGLAFGTTASHAAVIVSGPSNALYPYLDSAIPAGTQVTTLSLDPLDSHNVLSVGTTNQSRPWCGPGKRFLQAICPLFYSIEVAVGDQAPVLGTELLAPGTYPLYCTIHSSNQRGTLHVL